jgi:hypothetical protein
MVPALNATPLVHRNTRPPAVLPHLLKWEALPRTPIRLEARHRSAVREVRAQHFADSALAAMRQASAETYASPNDAPTAIGRLAMVFALLAFGFLSVAASGIH